MKAKLVALFKDNKQFLMFVLAMLLMRTAVADWYLVPSSSMYPNLVEGDRVFAYKLAYDIKLPFTDVVIKKVSEPQRGDIVTFASPEGGTRLVKRVIGLPGDTIEMVDGRLIVNGEMMEYQTVDASSVHLTPQREYQGQQLVYQESLGEFKHDIIAMPERAALRNFEPKIIPADSYFMMGDNRDNSNDSRFYGLVKRELIGAKVVRLFFSLDPDNYYLPRLERTIGKAI